METTNLKALADRVLQRNSKGNLVETGTKGVETFACENGNPGKLALPVFEPVDDLTERMAIMGENCDPGQTEPFITSSGILVIPFNSDKKYHYWAGGQSSCETLKQLGRCDLIPKYKSQYGEN